MSRKSKPLNKLKVVSADKRDSMIAEFKNLALRLGRVPSGDEFYLETGFTRAEVRTEFVKYQGLIEEACEYHRFAFKHIFTPKDFSPEKHKALLKDIGKYDSVIVTTAEPKAPVFKPFLNNLRIFAKKHNALIIIIRTKGDPLFLDGELKSEVILNDDLELNTNLKIWHVEAKASAASLAKGFKRYTDVESSLVVPSPKQEMHVNPNMGKMPRVVFSPGSVTDKIYGKTPSERKAREDHFFGAYLYDIQDESIFFPHNIDAFPDGSFVHKCVLYRPDGTSRKLRPDEVVRVDGDDHAMIHSKRVAAVLEDVQEKMPAHMKVSHDTWDQHISNHHNMHNKILLAQMATENKDRIERERKVTQEFLSKHAENFKKVLCVSSNHNEALGRFNAEGRYMNEYQNWQIGHILALAQFYKIDPVEFAINHYDEFVKKMEAYFQSIRTGKPSSILLNSKPLLSNVKFLATGEDFKWGGYSLGFHGDEGSGGSKGTVDAMGFIHSGNTASFNAGVITGHTHSSFKRNRTINVGTSTALPHEEDAPDYAKGKPNSWLNSFAMVYQPDEFKGLGTAQLFLIIDDQWEAKRKPSKRRKKAA